MAEKQKGRRISRQAINRQKKVAELTWEDHVNDFIRWKKAGGLAPRTIQIMSITISGFSNCYPLYARNNTWITFKGKEIKQWAS